MKLFKSILLVLSLVLCNATTVLASEEATEVATETTTKNPIITFISIVVFLVAAAATYYAMYNGTALIGTNQGIMNAIARRLVIPVGVGFIASIIITKILEFIFSIIIFIIPVAIGVVAYILYKKKKTSTSTEEAEEKE